MDAMRVSELPTTLICPGCGWMSSTNIREAAVMDFECLGADCDKHLSDYIRTGS